MSQRSFLSRIRPPFDARLLQSACCGQNSGDAEASAVFHRLAQEYGADRAFLFDSARQGLHCFFEAVNLGEGDGVVLADFNCRSMLTPIVRRGIRPVFVDVSSSFTYDVDQLHEALRIPSVKAVILTHFFGKSCWTPRLKEIVAEAAERGVFVIEDAAHSLEDDAQPDIGRVGQVVLFSFGNDKPLSAGKGGMILMRSPELVARMNEVYQRLRVRSLEEERGLLLWHVLYSLASKPEICPPGLPCALSSYVSPSAKEMTEIIQCIEENSTADTLASFTSVRKSLRLLNCRDRSIASRAIRRVFGLFRYARPASGQPAVPMQMNKLTQLVLSTYLCGGVLRRANARRTENHRYLLECLTSADLMQESGKVGVGARLRYTHVYNTADVARLAIAKARRADIEVGCFNWSPLLSSIVGVRREQPVWAVHPSRVVNYPVHPYLSGDDIARIADLLTFVKA